MNTQPNKIFIIKVIVIALISCQGLKKDEIAKVHFESYGDFGSEQSRLTIFEADGLTRAKLETKGDSVHVVNVSQEGLKIFNDFVSKLKTVKKSGFCTTDQSCIVYTKYGKIEKINIDCGWHGFYDLKKTLFHID